MIVSGDSAADEWVSQRKRCGVTVNRQRGLPMFKTAKAYKELIS